ncbi:MAG: IS5 family transposase [Balneolaceae bacterium]
MICYTPANQLTLEGFDHPFDSALDPENRWVKLAAVIPWDELAAVYSDHLSSTGRKSVDIRMVIGAVIVKHRLRLSDRETVAMIAENLYLQYFCGLKSFQTQPPFDPSLFVDIRKRMGAACFDAFNDAVIARSQQLTPPRKRVMREEDPKNTGQSGGSSARPAGDSKGNDEKPANKGRLTIDATVADQQIAYPTDLGLIHTARKESERLIDLLYKQSELTQKPRTYRRKAQAAYLAVAKKRRKSKKEIRKAIGAQLRYLRRNLGHIHSLLDRLGSAAFALPHRDQRIFWVIQLFYDQQKQMYDERSRSHPNRIVSIYQPWVRPIVRGKDKAKVEFGAKINISEYNGMSKIDTIGWEAYNESVDLPKQVERYKKTFGCYPELVLADRIYFNRANRAWLKAREIRIVGKPLGRPPKEELSAYQKRKRRKERNQRNLVEGKIGQGKNGYGLGCIKARRQDTAESWMGAIFFVMNLVTLMKVAGDYFFSVFLRRFSHIRASCLPDIVAIDLARPAFRPAGLVTSRGIRSWP